MKLLHRRMRLPRLLMKPHHHLMRHLHLLTKSPRSHTQFLAPHMQYQALTNSPPSQCLCSLTWNLTLTKRSSTRLLQDQDDPHLLQLLNWPAGKSSVLLQPAFFNMAAHRSQATAPHHHLQATVLRQSQTTMPQKLATVLQPLLQVTMPHLPNLLLQVTTHQSQAIILLKHLVMLLQLPHLPQVTTQPLIQAITHLQHQAMILQPQPPVTVLP